MKLVKVLACLLVAMPSLILAKPSVEHAPGKTAEEPEPKFQAGFVAFSAAMTGDMDAGDGDEIITYNIIDLDIGGHFGGTGSTFVVPTKGIYHFQFSVKGASSAVHLKVNGAVVRSTITNNQDGKTGNSNSNSIILDLSVGDIVATYQADWSSGIVNTSPTNGIFTSFSGFLLLETV